MNRMFDVRLNGPACRWRSRLLLLVLLGLSLAGCGGGGGSSDEEPAPAPPPPAPAPPPPPPPPGPSLPPISSTVISLDDGHTVGAARWGDGNTSVGGQGQPVEGLECAATSPVGFHAHAHLSIFLNGEALAIPNQVGFVTQAGGGCHYPLHTHDMSGLLHLHATAPRAFTLGQFFSIWGQPLQSTDIAGLLGMPVVVYVTEEGVVTKVDDNWAAIELKSHREITIQVGTAITEIPNFTWTGD